MGNIVLPIDKHVVLMPVGWGNIPIYFFSGMKEVFSLLKETKTLHLANKSLRAITSFRFIFESSTPYSYISPRIQFLSIQLTILLVRNLMLTILELFQNNPEFENCLIRRFDSYLNSSGHQMGFQKGISCSHAIYSFRKIADNYTVNDSTVSVCSLDLSKTFDKVNPSAL